MGRQLFHVARAKAAALELEERGESKRQKALKRELEWVQKSPSGRQAKNKARIERYEQLADQRGKGDETEVEILVAQGPRLGTKVIEIKDIAKAYGENLLFQDLSFSVPPGAIVGIVGANGAGKTTLFRMITGHESPDQGAVELGETVKLAHVGQFRDELPDNETVWEAISGGSDELDFGGRTLNSRAYVNRFGFTGNDQSKEVGVLSGGEPQPGALGSTAARPFQRDAARRTQQRPRREHHACARRSHWRIRGMRPGHQPRPLVPRPRGHAHLGL